jgi:UDP-glucose:(heptosyl)LPS alpha-1,3-glucosyltransferase
MSVEVLFIVKRYTVNGGMEKYVWELTHSLAGKGVSVHILCEYSDICFDDRIEVHKVASSFPKPRWVAMVKFSSRASKWLKKHPSNKWIVHSHERTSFHHLTTFHGPPFANVYQKPWWKRMSLRVKVWLFLEKRELCANNVQFVLPNSEYISKQLRSYYPCLNNRILNPAFPAVHKNNITFKKDRNTIVFIGREWKRKGLKKAIAIVQVIKKTNKNIKFLVVGPKKKEVEYLFKNWDGGYELLGWSDSQPILEGAGLLLHPAKMEPYGMAIAEASNLGTRVVISDQCGVASKVNAKSGQVISVDSSIDVWASACLDELSNQKQAETIGNSWDDLAEEHISLYQKIKL